MVKHKYWLKHIFIPLARVWRNLTVRRLLWGVAFFLATVLILGSNLMPKLQLQVGQPSPEEFTARQTITFESELRTEAARQEATRQVKTVYRVDPSVLMAIQSEVNRYFATTLLIKNEITDENIAINRLQQGLNLRLPPETWNALARADRKEISYLEEQIAQVLSGYMGNGVQEQAVDITLERMLAAVTQFPVSESLKAFVREILKTVEVRPNLVYDPEGTSKEVQQAQGKVEPVKVTINRDQTIIRKGDPVTEEHIEALEKLGFLRKQQAPYAPILGLTLLIAVIYVLIFCYLYQYHRNIFNHEPHLMLFGLLVITTLLLTKGLAAINLGQPEAASQAGYLAPVAAGAMLIGILLNSRLAVFSTIIFGVFTGLAVKGQLSYAVVAVLGGMAGVYSVSHLSQRHDLAKSSFYIIVANVTGIVAMGLLQTTSISSLLWGSLLGVINGVLSSVLTIGSLPFLETAFGITTSVRLLELSNPSQPLLKRVLLEAPGTYHHSLMISNMAEAAADAVGADSLLARVGAYYHDIGKVKRPYFFIENQMSGENPHDKLAPTLSTLIITSHVKDGLEMARVNRLPQVICDIIEQHHGTSMVSFFFHKAMENSRSESVAESDFRYETRKPQNKEAAIVMLADSVEATVRSLQKPTPGRMEGTVRKIIKEKLEDGQLSCSDLTFRDLDIIAQAFVRVLSGIFHSRIEYPDVVLKELERRKNRDAALRSKPAG